MWKTVEGGPHAKSVVVVVVCVAVMTLTIGLVASVSTRAAPTLPTTLASKDAEVSPQLSPSGNGNHVYVVKPNGHDDTADIQAAFNACMRSGGACTVQLEKGTYYTAQITVFGFQGKFVGVGQGLTTVQALPNLPSPAAAANTYTYPFWTERPSPSNPWPCLFTFMNGTFGISGMTITDPYSVAVSPGWDSSSIAGGIPTDTALYDAIEITGFQAYATIDHVTILGAAGDADGTNMWDAITYEGTFLPTGWTGAVAQRLSVSGTFTVTNSVFNDEQSGPFADTFSDTTLTVCYNTLTNSPAPLGFIDASNSQLTFCGNREPSVSYGAGFLGESSVDRFDFPSTVYITDNHFELNNDSNAMFLLDFAADFGEASTLTAVVTGNVFQTDTSCGCYVGTDPGDYSVIVSENLRSLVVSENTFLGGGAAAVYVVGGPAVVSGNTILGSYVGVWVDYANSTTVIGNLIKNSEEYGIAVTDGSSYNVVAWNVVKNSGVDDLYWDGTGTGNVWIGNVYGTSSPPGL